MELDAESQKIIFRQNLTELNDALKALPRNSVKLSLDEITLANILRLSSKNASSTFYPLTFRKGEENEWEAIFNVEKSKDHDIELKLHRYEYNDEGKKGIVGISVDFERPSELAYGIRFWEALYNAASSSKVPKVQVLWNEFKKTNLHIYKSPITGDPFRAGTIIFTLGQFKGSEEIEKFILGEFMK